LKDGEANMERAIKVRIVDRRLPGGIRQSERIIGIVCRKSKEPSETAKARKVSIFLEDVINGHRRRPRNIFMP